ncbi:DUF5906 domain-containing protein [Pseudocolwellia agarivorans]|uniref:DUF5906 domain-containing protein n=1 Tax=Pseudocolwellia agarivorans TaxID=1911682 RepID=UPI000986E6F3|nr:DUF5906 domain-containing protein [Pseudocolwellia agarivorans]
MTKLINPNHNLNPIAVCLFKSAKDNQITPEKTEVMTWKSFIDEFMGSEHNVIEDKKNQSGFITASPKSIDDDGVETTENYSGETVLLRKAVNIDKYSAVVVDIDGGMTINDVNERFNDLEYLGYTSYGHMTKTITDDEGNESGKEFDESVHKLRLVFLLKEPVDKDELLKRKQALLRRFEGADTSTFDRARLFYTPSCPAHMLEHAKIWHNHGELFDLLSLEENEVKTDLKPVERPDLSNGQREAIVTGLLKTGRVEDDLWYKIAGALHCNSFSVQQFIEVSSVLKPSKSAFACIRKWESSKKYEFSLGVVINFLKKHDIFIYQKRVVDNSEEIEFVNKEIELLNEKLDRVKSNDKLTDEERKKQIQSVEEEIENKEAEVNQLIEDEKPTLYDLVDELIATRLIYYVSDQGVLTEYLPDQGQWVDYKVTDFIHGEFLSGIRGARSFLQKRLQAFRRSYRTQKLSAKQLPDYILNRFRRDHWVTPKAGKYHEVFDILIRSLGDNKTENMKHIIQVIAWKYLYPEAYDLPCIVIYGEGGAGKNTLVERLLGTMFGKNQVIAIRQEQMRNFNGLIEGKIAVLLDEASSDKANMDQLKHMIGQESLVIDRKYGKNYQSDNLALYFTGGNGALGAVYLGRDQSDRRFSILQVDRSIIDHVMEVKGFDKRQDAVDWWTEHKHLLENREQVSMWLHSILTSVEDLKSPPKELHGQDYEALLAAQAGPLEWIIDHVFDRPDFKYIHKDIPFQLYEIKARDFGTKNPMGKPTFDAKLKDALRKRHDYIESTSRKIKDLTGNLTTGTGYFIKGLVGAVDEVVYVYDDPEHKGRKKLANDWFEPEVVITEDEDNNSFDNDLME